MHPSLSLHHKVRVQRYVSRQMRAVLVDWLVDVHFKFKVCAAMLCKHLTQQRSNMSHCSLCQCACCYVTTLAWAFL